MAAGGSVVRGAVAGGSVVEMVEVCMVVGRIVVGRMVVGRIVGGRIVVGREGAGVSMAVDSVVWSGEGERSDFGLLVEAAVDASRLAVSAVRFLLVVGRSAVVTDSPSVREVPFASGVSLKPPVNREWLASPFGSADPFDGCVGTSRTKSGGRKPSVPAYGLSQGTALTHL